MADTGTAPQLRPLALGEILDASFKVYARKFKTLCLCVLVPIVPVTILQTVILASTSENAFDPTKQPATTDGLSGAALGGFAASTLLVFLLSILAAAACTRAVAAAYLGEDATWGESIRFALRRFLPLIVVSLVSIVVVFAGFIALLIPGIYIGTRIIVATPALLFEGVGPGAALRRSWRLVADRWWASFGLVLVALLLVTVVSSVLQLLLVAPLIAGDGSEALAATLTTIGSIVSNVLTLPFLAAAITVLYFDLRVRKEGFDLERLARDTGSTSPESVGRSAGLGAETHGGFAPPRAPG